jgi:hypothetical protein
MGRIASMTTGTVIELLPIDFSGIHDTVQSELAQHCHCGLDPQSMDAGSSPA